MTLGPFPLGSWDIDLDFSSLLVLIEGEFPILSRCSKFADRELISPTDLQNDTGDPPGVFWEGASMGKVLEQFCELFPMSKEDRLQASWKFRLDALPWVLPCLGF